MYVKKINLRLFDGEGAAAGGNAAVVDAGSVPKTDESRVIDRSKSAAERRKQVNAARTGKAATAAHAAAAQAAIAHETAPAVETPDTVSKTIPPKGAAEAEAQAQEAQGQGAKPDKLSFEELINGEYKAEYQASLKKILDRRFRQADESEKKITEVSPILEMLSARYGIKDGSPASLLSALRSDEEMWEQAAERNNMSVPQYKASLELQMQAAKDASEVARLKAENEKRANFERLKVESEQVKKIYPDFDLNVETQNEGFNRLIRSGVPMQHAYRMMHYDDLVKSEVSRAVTENEERLKQAITEANKRPAEFSAGITGVQAASSPFANMNPAQRRAAVEAARRRNG